MLKSVPDGTECEVRQMHPDLGTRETDEQVWRRSADSDWVLEGSADTGRGVSLALLDLAHGHPICDLRISSNGHWAARFRAVNHEAGYTPRPPLLCVLDPRRRSEYQAPSEYQLPR